MWVWQDGRSRPAIVAGPLGIVSTARNRGSEPPGAPGLSGGVRHRLIWAACANEAQNRGTSPSHELFDEEVVAEHKLDTLRFGDLVAIIDADHTYGRIYRTGSVSIGVIVHSRSWTAGHGPGVTTLFTSKEGRIETVIDPDANLAALLRIR